MTRPSPQSPPLGGRKLWKPSPLLRDAGTPPITLTTPEGLTRLDHIDGSCSSGREPPRALALNPALLSEPPPTPARADLTIDAFAEGYSLVIGPSDEEDGDDGGAGMLGSPFADPDDDVEEEEEEDYISYWSFSSSGSSSDSDSDDDDDGIGAAEIMEFGQYDGDPVRILCTDPNGLTSFPSLEPYPGDHHGGGGGDAFGGEELGEAAAEAADKAASTGNSATLELLEAVEAVESEYAGGGWWRSSSSSSSQGARPLPSWAWLRSSNTFPMYRLGPNDLRHGPSKLRLACSAADDYGGDGMVESGVGGW